MKLRTKVKIESHPGFVHHGQNLLSLGSCFAINVGSYLELRQFNLINNPLGILFNPVSIEKRLRAAFENDLNEKNIVERDEHFFHYDYHSAIGKRDRNELCENIRQELPQLRSALKNADRLILTFGTAWVYRLKSSGEIVANCHKMPQNLFEKELLTLEDLRSRYSLLFEFLKTENPKLEIILTVSPVRHTKNGIHENNLSKSVLLLLCNALKKQFDFVHYFPAYELIIDDLRDYRFYNSDLIHPNATAIEYVCKRFEETYFSEKSLQLCTEAMKLVRLSRHMPQFPSVEQKRKMQLTENNLREKIRKLKDEF